MLESLSATLKSTQENRLVLKSQGLHKTRHVSGSQLSDVLDASAKIDYLVTTTPGSEVLGIGLRMTSVPIRKYAE